MNNKKKIILGSIIGVLIGTLISVSYAFFTFSKTSNNNSQLVVGDIYMKYTGNNELDFEGAMPSSSYTEGKYFEFEVSGKNTTTNKDIIYDIVINHGIDNPKSRTTRIADKFLKFRLVEVVEENNVRQEVTPDLIEGKSYNEINNTRIYVRTIPKNTTTEIKHIYRLYAWIDQSVVISNNGGDYTPAEWANLYASIQVNVTGDFNEKEVYKGPKLSTEVLKHITSANSDVDSDNVTYISGCSDEAETDADCTEANKIDFNFVWYSGKLWRIVAIYPDGAMKLITENPITAIYWGSNTTYNGSWVYQWLNEDFNDTLVNKDKTIDNTKIWNATTTSDTTKPAETTMVSGNVGLLNAYEYAESYKKINNQYGYDKGYLNIKQWWWLLNPCSSSNVYGVYSGGSYDSNKPSYYTGAVRPSIITKSSITFAGGAGTRNNPYVIGEDISAPTTNALLNTRVSGEYVIFKNELFRIVGAENEITKLVKADYIMDGSYPLTKKFASSVTFGSSINSNDESYWDYYLNNTWLPTSDTTNRALLDEGTYYLGEYGSTGISYKTTICKDSDLNLVKTKNCTKYTENDANRTYTGYVGLLRVGEMFSSQLKGALSSYPAMWLITPSSSAVNNVDYDSRLSQTRLKWSNAYAVRPTVNLKSNIIITGGDGTEQNPFEIALGS